MATIVFPAKIESIFQDRRGGVAPQLSAFFKEEPGDTLLVIRSAFDGLSSQDQKTKDKAVELLVVMTDLNSNFVTPILARHSFQRLFSPKEEERCIARQVLVGLKGKIRPEIFKDERHHVLNCLNPSYVLLRKNTQQFCYEYFTGDELKTQDPLIQEAAAKYKEKLSQERVELIREMGVGF